MPLLASTGLCLGCAFGPRGVEGADGSTQDLVPRSCAAPELAEGSVGGSSRGMSTALASAVGWSVDRILGSRG